MALTHDVTDTLNELIQICRDGDAGFTAAAEAVDDPALRSELVEYSAQRRRFAEELQFRVASTGEDPVERGSIAGALHRGWIDLRTAIATNDRYAILSECERGEDAAVAAYRKAMESELPPEYDTIVQLQSEDVLRTHDRVKALRDRARVS
jgi:uncharacterized protein (TIGR02284 family)